jgi:hypothetical protein
VAGIGFVYGLYTENFRQYIDPFVARQTKVNSAVAG